MQKINLKQKNKISTKKGIVFIPLFFGLIILMLAISTKYYIVTTNSVIKTLTPVYDTEEGIIDIEEVLDVGTKLGISGYINTLLLLSLDPATPGVGLEILQQDAEDNWKILKESIKLGIISTSLQNMISTSSKSNFTCFCAPYDPIEFQNAVTNSIKKQSIYLPKNARHIPQCVNYIDISIISLNLFSNNSKSLQMLPLTKQSGLVRLDLNKNYYRFACISQEGNYAFLDLLPTSVTVTNLTIIPFDNVSSELKYKINNLINYTN